MYCLVLRLVYLLPQRPSNPKHAEHPIDYPVHKSKHADIARAFDEMKQNLILWGSFLFLIALSGGAVPHAYAAPLNFSTAESITLSSPPTTLTIATSSVADALTANATSVLVTLSQTTGGSFALLSPSYDLSVATSSGGGSAIVSCSGGIETATLSQTTGSTVYTVTPTTQNCASASAPIITVSPTSTNITSNTATITWTTNLAADSTVSYGTTISYGATSTDPTLVTAHSISLTGLSASTPYHYAVTSASYGTSTTSGDNTFTTSAPDLTVTVNPAPAPVVSSGGGGSSGGSSSGGGGGGSYFPIPPASTPTATVISGNASLLDGLFQLVQEARSLSAAMLASAPARPLTVGSQGNDVWALQVFLITNNVISPTSPEGAKLTNPTGYFGSLTQGALAAYQQSVGITPDAGYFGPKTRATVLGGTVATATPAPMTTATASSLSFGSTGTTVSTLQNILVQDSFLSASVFTPGTFDIPTERAVEVFQCLESIACSDAAPGYGTVGPKTRAALGM